jgi:hypothetical protein
MSVHWYGSNIRPGLQRGRKFALQNSADAPGQQKTPWKNPTYIMMEIDCATPRPVTEITSHFTMVKKE